jgi:cyclase
MPLGYGGGIRDIDDIKEILAAGVEKVIINSYACENPLFIKSAADKFGSQSIVVSIDVKKGLLGKFEVFSHSGLKRTGLSPVEFAQRLEEMGAGELLLNSIDRDGTMKGYDLGVIKRVSDVVTIPVIACGGAGKVEDLGEAINAGASAVSAGSLFVFHGRHRAVLINFPSEKELGRVVPGCDFC